MVVGSSLGTNNDERIDFRTDKFDPALQRVRLFALKNFLVLGLVTFVIGGALVPWPGRFFNDLPTFYVCVSLIFCIAGELAMCD